MSYYNQQPGGYPPQQQGYPPQGQGYGQPPPNQYPPSGSPYPPPQQGYQAPPMNQQQYPPQQGYGAPPQQPQYGAPPQQQYGQQPAYGAPPPQQQYGAPPPGQYGAPPPNQQYPPPQQQYGAPPPGQYGAPPPQPYGQPGYGAPPPGPPGQFGAPPVQQGFPSPGYGQQTAPIDVTQQVEGLKKAFRGFGTDEKVVIKIVAKQDPIQINTIREQFNQRLMTDLLKKVEAETSGNFKLGLLAVFRGPLMADCWALFDAMKGLGTKETVLDDVLIGRSNADMNAIKVEYQRLFRKSLEADLRGDLSAGTEQLFVMVVAARRNEETAPVIPQQIEADTNELQRAMGNMLSKDSAQTCQILSSRSDAQLRAITHAYQQRFHKSLESVIKSKFSGHMENALVLLLARANNRAASDAVQLEETMAGLGTKDQLLIQRLVRIHWDQRHMAQVRNEFQRIYKRDLVKRIKGETSGDYERLLVGLAELEQPDPSSQPDQSTPSPQHSQSKPYRAINEGLHHRPHSTDRRNVNLNAGFEDWLVQNNIQLTPGLKAPLHIITTLVEEQRKTNEDTLGPKARSKQEAMHQTARSQDIRAGPLAEHVKSLKKVAWKTETGREWQRWYDEVYGKRLWDEWVVGDEMPVTEVFVDAWCASDDEEGSECGCGK